ncbi:MAG: MG2 domain-containing protein, partial [Bacteroidota bacterium]|nr:MG2 domain-containing protein [Bacteroidota bacterium]
MKNSLLPILFSFALVTGFLAPFALDIAYTPAEAVKQPSAYEAEWKEVERLIMEGLYSSARELAFKIYTMAKEEINAPQQVKAALKFMEMNDRIEEESLVKNIRWLEKETESVGQPVKAIFHSILADNYLAYWDYHNGELDDRTIIPGAALDTNIAEWDEGQFRRKIRELQLLSLAPEKILKNNPVRNFTPILDTGPESERYRPTLYDLLVHKVIDEISGYRYNRDDDEVLPPDERYFLPAADFITARFQPEANDTIAPYNLFGVRLFQRLLVFHFADDSPAPLLDADLQRLAYVHKKTTLENKDKLYFNALEALAAKYEAFPQWTEIMYLQAELVHGGYIPEKYAGQGSPNKIALLLCEQAITRFPGSYGAKQCAALKNDILTKTLSSHIKEYAVPGRSILMKVDYRNLETVYYKVIKAPAEYNIYDEKTVKKFLKQKAVLNGQYALPTPGDYEDHSTEVAIPALPLGKYIVILSVDPAFTYEKNITVANPIQVSGLRAIREILYDNSNRHVYRVVDPESGMPVIGAAVLIKIWDNASRTYVFLPAGNEITDEDGRFEFSLVVEYPTELKINISKNNDEIVFNSSIDYSDRHMPDSATVKSDIFTDRCIYRPGQTVYFKGIQTLIHPEADKSRARKNTKATITLEDVNGQEIATRSLVTNEFGSYAGSFILPAGLLNGQMVIRDEHGSQTIQVEEYKRPKFEVMFDPLHGHVRLNEKVSVAGSAVSYTGVPLAGVPVKYRVYRTARYPYWHTWRRPPSSSDKKEISSGVVSTDARGKFTVSFAAVPDEQISPEDKPEYTYNISADVLDISGETQSGETRVTVGYAALRVFVQMPEWAAMDSALQIIPQVVNLNGMQVNTDGTLTIEELQQPERLYKQRLWEKPDQHALSEEEFHKNFPDIPYKDEAQVENYPVKAHKLSVSLKGNMPYSAGVGVIGKWDPGIYRVRYSTVDSFGQPVEAVIHVRLFDVQNGQASFREYLYHIPRKTTGLKPGEDAVIIVGSAAKVRVHLSAEQGSKIFYSSTVELDNSQETVRIAIPAGMKENFFIYVQTVVSDRIYFEQVNGAMESDRKLEIVAGTFRDKLHPGDKERWSFTIKGAAGDAVAAEMLAAMYDASLDAFLPHEWRFASNRGYSSRFRYFSNQFSKGYGRMWHNGMNRYTFFRQRQYDRMISSMLYDRVAGLMTDRDRILGAPDDNLNPMKEKDKAEDAAPPVTPRKNLDETAFFFPQLRTNEKGEIVFEFTMPEALTKWKFMALAHTPDLKSGQYTTTVVTQKELMIQPNAPRFVRIGDSFFFTAKVTNLSDKQQEVRAGIKFSHAADMSNVKGILDSPSQSIKSLALKPGESAAVRWPVSTSTLEEGVVVYTVTAYSESYSDGEEAPLPVLSSRTLISESLPLPIRGNETRKYTFDKLVNYKSSSTLRPHRLTLEMTSNPAWYAVQSLPYLAEFPYECAEQVFNRYYASSISRHIAVSDPRIEKMIREWQSQGPSTRVSSSLEMNPELRNILLEATPWLRDAKDDAERRQRLAGLFDLKTLEAGLLNAVTQLENMQLDEGAWPWFGGMQPNRYITQYIVAGFGHLKQMGIEPMYAERINEMMTKAIAYMDREADKEYEDLKRSDVKMEEYHLSYNALNYLYARSFFGEMKGKAKSYGYWLKQGEEYWLRQNLMGQAMLATTMHRDDRAPVAKSILASLSERALHSEEMGMYWKENNSGYYWYEHPVETQSMLIEAYDLVLGDVNSVEEMKIWLLKNKQTSNWRTTKATAEACYALLLRGTDLLSSEKLVNVYLDSKLFDVDKHGDRVKPEPGTGYYSYSWPAEEITPGMGKVKVQKADAGIAWGALYFQYYEDIDKVASAGASLTVKRDLFITENSSKGPVLIPLTKQALRVGDLVKVRLTITCDRYMEYVHLKDLRAAALEPVE